MSRASPPQALRRTIPQTESGKKKDPVSTPDGRQSDRFRQLAAPRPHPASNDTQPSAAAINAFCFTGSPLEYFSAWLTAPLDAPPPVLDPNLPAGKSGFALCNATWPGTRPRDRSA